MSKWFWKVTFSISKVAPQSTANQHCLRNIHMIKATTVKQIRLPKKVIAIEWQLGHVLVSDVGMLKRFTLVVETANLNLN